MHGALRTNEAIGASARAGFVLTVQIENDYILRVLRIEPVLLQRGKLLTTNLDRVRFLVEKHSLLLVMNLVGVLLLEFGLVSSHIRLRRLLLVEDCGRYALLHVLLALGVDVVTLGLLTVALLLHLEVVLVSLHAGRVAELVSFLERLAQLVLLVFVQGGLRGLRLEVLAI